MLFDVILVGGMRVTERWLVCWQFRGWNLTRFSAAESYEIRMSKELQNHSITGCPEQKRCWLEGPQLELLTQKYAPRGSKIIGWHMWANLKPMTQCYGKLVCGMLAELKNTYHYIAPLQDCPSFWRTHLVSNHASVTARLTIQFPAVKRKRTRLLGF